MLKLCSLQLKKYELLKYPPNRRQLRSHIPVEKQSCIEPWKATTLGSMGCNRSTTTHMATQTATCNDTKFDKRAGMSEPSGIQDNTVGGHSEASDHTRDTVPSHVRDFMSIVERHLVLLGTKLLRQPALVTGLPEVHQNDSNCLWANKYGEYLGRWKKSSLRRFKYYVSDSTSSNSPRRM